MAVGSFELCRSCLFIGGPDTQRDTARESQADVVILELKDFTPPEARQGARSAASKLFQAWRETGAISAVRVNPLAGDGRADLSGVTVGAPEIVMLPKVGGTDDVAALDHVVTEEERRLGLEQSRTKLVPNIESAAALFQTREIAAASPRVVACLMASEDLTAVGPTDEGGWRHRVRAGVLSRRLRRSRRPLHRLSLHLCR